MCLSNESHDGGPSLADFVRRAEPFPVPPTIRGSDLGARPFEERLLSKEKARENFGYFMRVRLQRAAYFRSWLHRYFFG
jgi:hypothetical protein